MTGPNNPLFIPTVESKQLVCPKCSVADYSGRKVQGVITFKCRACSTEWQGGLPREPVDPRTPLPPENPLNKPPVTFNRDRNGQFHEERRPVSLTPEFRKGALVPPTGEEDV